MPAYARVGDSEYLEVFGLDFESFEVGQTFRHRPGITLSAQDVTDESLDTFNSAQIHYDAVYAANTEFKQPLAVSTLTLQKCLGMTWKTFARKDRIEHISDIRMENPLYAGTTLYAESEILALEERGRPYGLVSVRTRGLDEDGREFIRIDYHVRIFKRGQFPAVKRLDADFDLTEQRFSAFRMKDGVLVEQTGLYFDDFVVGETFHHRPNKFTGEAESTQHARRSMDWNPRFNNPKYATTNFADAGAPLTESYTIGSTTASTTRTFGRVVANLSWKNIRLERLVYPGEVFFSESTIVDMRNSRSRPDQGILTVSTIAKDENSKSLLSYDRVLMVYKENSGPYSGSGY